MVANKVENLVQYKLDYSTLVIVIASVSANNNMLP